MIPTGKKTSENKDRILFGWRPTVHYSQILYSISNGITSYIYTDFNVHYKTKDFIVRAAEKQDQFFVFECFYSLLNIQSANTCWEFFLCRPSVCVSVMCATFSPQSGHTTVLPSVQEIKRERAGERKSVQREGVCRSLRAAERERERLQRWEEAVDILLMSHLSWWVSRLLRGLRQGGKVMFWCQRFLQASLKLKPKLFMTRRKGGCGSRWCCLHPNHSQQRVCKFILQARCQYCWKARHLRDRMETEADNKCEKVGHKTAVYHIWPLWKKQCIDINTVESNQTFLVQRCSAVFMQMVNLTKPQWDCKTSVTQSGSLFKLRYYR